MYLINLWDLRDRFWEATFSEFLFISHIKQVLQDKYHCMCIASKQGNKEK